MSLEAFGTAGMTPALSLGQVMEQSGIRTDILKAELPIGMLVGDVGKFELVLAPAQEVQQDQDSNVSSPSSSIIVQLKYGNVLVPMYSSGADFHVGDLRTALASEKRWVFHLPEVLPLRPQG